MEQAIELYENLIDELVKRKESAAAKWILSGKNYPDTKENEKINELLNELSDDKKKIIAGMLQDARESGIHDTLALLDEKMDLDDLVITEKGCRYPYDIFDSMHFDFVCRSQGDEWPEI